MQKVAFVCVHNSCRSQIAEALGRHLAADVFESYSAGTERKDHMNPDAVRLMKELYHIDMETEGQHSKLLSEIPPVDGICCIKVLGAGCKSCHEQFENAQAAVRTMGLSVEVEYITDMEKVMEYGVISMPAIVVNEKVVSMGKVLKAADVEKLLHKLGY